MTTFILRFGEYVPLDGARPAPELGLKPMLGDIVHVGETTRQVGRDGLLHTVVVSRPRRRGGKTYPKER